MLEGHNYEIELSSDDLLKDIEIRFEWSEDKCENEENFHDIQLFTIILNDKGLLDCDSDIVFYNNRNDSNFFVYFDSTHDRVLLDFSNVKSQTTKVVIIGNIGDAKQRKQNFSQMSSLYMYRNFGDNKTPFAFKYLPNSDAMMLCEFVKKGNRWFFVPATGARVNDLYGFLEEYGMNQCNNDNCYDDFKKSRQNAIEKYNSNWKQIMNEIERFKIDALEFEEFKTSYIEILKKLENVAWSKVEETKKNEIINFIRDTEDVFNYHKNELQSRYTNYCESMKNILFKLIFLSDTMANKEQNNIINDKVHEYTLFRRLFEEWCLKEL